MNKNLKHFKIPTIDSPSLNHTLLKMPLPLQSIHNPAIHSISRFTYTRTRPFNLLHSARPRCISISVTKPISLNTICSYTQKNGNFTAKLDDPEENHHQQSTSTNTNFWGAVSLIIGTAVGPGMLGLPAITIKAGPLPSTVAILLSWVYVVSSIILVAELTFAAMEEDGVKEVSFTGLATKALGSQFGTLVAVVYACLSFALIVACVSGIGSIMSQWFPFMHPMLAFALFPLTVGIIIQFFQFRAIDSANRLLCFLMLVSITSLVGIGLSVARADVVNSFSNASWNIASILPAIPVTVLTLGFHVITPFICKLAGDTVSGARKAILIGGAVPLVMVLSWNLIVLGLSGRSGIASTEDPISLLLSVDSSALLAVQGFAFTALATSLIGYSVSFPKQLVDTLNLILWRNKNKPTTRSGRVGFVEYSIGNSGRTSFGKGKREWTELESFGSSSISEGLVMPVVLGAPILIASMFRSTFAKALDFAGVYANCFLFGVLPPLMAYIQLSRKKMRPTVIPGGYCSLALLFGIAVALGIWH